MSLSFVLLAFGRIARLPRTQYLPRADHACFECFGRLGLHRKNHFRIFRLIGDTLRYDFLENSSVREIHMYIQSHVKRLALFQIKNKNL